MTSGIGGADAVSGAGPYPDDLIEFYDSAPCGFLSAHDDGTISAANQTLADWLGMDSHDIVGRRLQSLLDVGGQMYYETTLKPLLTMQGFLREVAIDLVTPSGRRLPTLLGARVRNFPGRAPVVYVTVVDATERRRYENDLIGLAKRERESRDLLESVLDSLPSPTAVLDGDGSIIRVSPAWEDVRRHAGGDSASCGVGVSYLEVCDRSAASGCLEAAEVAAGLRAVLSGNQTTFEYLYVTGAADEALDRWFRLLITQITGQPGAIAVHNDVTSQVRFEQELRKQAARDSLTQLPNRSGLERYLTTILIEGGSARHFTLFFIDIDHFKQVNDRYGHQTGDAVLVEVGRRILAATRDGDLACRLGGDEFVLGLVDCESSHAEAAAERLKVALSKPIDVNGLWIDVSVSFGVANAELTQPDVHQLIARADAAMYEAKTAGRNGYRFAT